MVRTGERTITVMNKFSPAETLISFLQNNGINSRQFMIRGLANSVSKGFAKYFIITTVLVTYRLIV
jgi:hypothetical protein